MVLSALFCRHGPVGIVLSALFCRHCSVGIVLSALFCRHCSVGMVLSAWCCRHGAVAMVLWRLPAHSRQYLAATDTLPVEIGRSTEDTRVLRNKHTQPREQSTKASLPPSSYPPTTLDAVLNLESSFLYPILTHISLSASDSTSSQDIPCASHLASNLLT
ncbi:hypothetical protein L211DRAFT_333433 [Terfezia boudieri ATCC MYA-4762]|uniref:Uncharacterized protein n=1 Tax=Terfezia boudieri ATCC MYA-4762 TaxID=1051890 RepID=A0A3N4LWA6_9PEZI|nr:hypothetical protein L211DRAFT_333433 [Terfezia boudieri ATCC MYA-4762]